MRFCFYLALHSTAVGGLLFTLTTVSQSKISMLLNEAALFLTTVSAAIIVLKLRAVIEGSKSLVYLKNHSAFMERASSCRPMSRAGRRFSK